MSVVKERERESEFALLRLGHSMSAFSRAFNETKAALRVSLFVVSAKRQTLHESLGRKEFCARKRSY